LVDCIVILLKGAKCFPAFLIGGEDLSFVREQQLLSDRKYKVGIDMHMHGPRNIAEDFSEPPMQEAWEHRPFPGFQPSKGEEGTSFNTS